MHQKMVIFKEENNVWWGTKFSNITKWQYFLDELNLKLKNKTCQEISKITKWHYVVDELNLKFKNKHVTIIFDSTSFGTLGKNWFTFWFSNVFQLVFHRCPPQLFLLREWVKSKNCMF